MFRVAALPLLLFLAGCEKLMAEKQDRSWDAMRAAVEARLETQQLKAELTSLKADIERDRDSLTESRNNHSALLNRFNENVDIDNKRHRAISSDLDWLRRHTHQ